MTHGAWSKRKWRPLADRLAAELVTVASWCSAPAYAPTVSAWARAESQLQLVSAWLDENGVVDDEGQPRPATNLQAQLDTQAHRLRQELALTPAALARLLGSISGVLGKAGEGDALAAVREQGAQLARGARAQLTAAEEAS